VLAVVAARVAGAHAADGADPVEALRDGYARAYLTAAGFVAGAMVLTAFLPAGSARGEGRLGPDLGAGGDPAPSAAALEPPLCRQ